MNYNLNLGLKGEYKVDLYSGKKLVESTDWFSNDITNVGLTYPLFYSFAQCFMFLSLGKEIHINTNNQSYTGLADPIKTFKVVKESDGVLTYTGQSGQYMGWPGYAIGSPKTASLGNVPQATTCGTRITDKGLRLYRGWTIPSGDDGNYSMGEPLNIQQLMVSPSSGSDDKGNKAFSLVNRSIFVPSGFNATITYQLSIDFENFKPLYTFFSGKNVQGTNGFFNTGDAITGVNGSNELELLSGWSNLSGIFRQILPGIEVVDGLGACFVQYQMGSDMEPKEKDCKYTHFYLSPDMSQFAISKSGKYGTEYEAYNSNGLCINYYELLNANNGTLDFKSMNAVGSKAYSTEGGNKWFYYTGSQNTLSSNPIDAPFFEKIRNIHLENLLSIENYKTGSLNLKYLTNRYTGAKNFPVAFATPGKVGLNDSLSDFGQRIVLSTSLKRIPIHPSVLDTGNRTKYVTKKAVISPINCYGHNSRYGSLVLGHNYSRNTSALINAYTFSPLIDFLFFDSEGRGANMSHYRIPTIYLSERGSGISKVRFDVTGADGNQVGTLSRLSGIYGFMGSGTLVSPLSPSGLDKNHPLLSTSLRSDLEPYYIPSGPKKVGLLLEGEKLNQYDPGNNSYAGGTGWGAVYGLVTDEDYYLRKTDSILIDVPNWSGFGRVPNPTGDNELLYWPNKENKFSGGLKISEVAYYLKGTGIPFNDPGNNYFENYQIINDIIYNDGQGFSVSLLDTTGLNGKPNFYFREKSAGNFLPMNNGSFTAYLTSGKSTNNYDILSLGLKNYEKGSQDIVSVLDKIHFTHRLYTKNIKESDFINFYFTFGAVNIDPKSAITQNQNNYYLFYSGNNNLEPTYLDNTGYFKIIPTKFKKPKAELRHVENIGDEGFRLLPNYAIPNNEAINTYLPVTGGSFPGLSTENGMELYLTISWTGA